MTFGASRWALDHLLTSGGSAYLPRRLADPLIEQGRLHRVQGAPEFTRRLHLSWREASLTAFPWLADPLRWLRQGQGSAGAPTVGSPPAPRD